MEFNYSVAFSRNIGWLTKNEQTVIRNKRISIAGMGGVGGAHLLTLTRLGVGKFNIADFDAFGVENFNRQVGAKMSTVNQPKAQTMANQALDINPELDINIFSEGINKDNVEEFLEDVDIYIDGLDFFAVEARRSIFAATDKLEIPSVTAAPLGMGAAVLSFLPGKMTFEEYFRLEGQSETEQLFRFFVGLAPKATHSKYLVQPDTIDLSAHKGPSTSMGCEICAGVAASQALKILLQRGKILCAPHSFQYDAYCNKTSHSWLPGGNQNPLQKARLFIVKKLMPINKR